MGSWLADTITQLRKLPPGRQALFGATAAFSLAFVFWLVTRAAAPEFRVLYRGLEMEEASQVAEVLRSERIEHRFDDGGATVLVEAGQLYEARIRVAGQGLPSGNGAGFELFDRPAFGVTDFVHRVNYTRAVQGELSRTIEQLAPVERARVQVVMPDRRTVLSARERKPSAAVVLALRPGHQLGGDQVQAVVHLVASSVESLAPENVTIVDGAGRLLAPTGDGTGRGRLAAGGAPGYQQRLEQELSARVEDILEKTAGPGAVVARVRADMDWTESETTEESFDPDSQVARSEQRNTETTSDGAPTPGGVPGVAANTPGDPAIATASVGAAGATSERIAETINYEISKKVSRSLRPMGNVERLSVAVLVADRVDEEGVATAWPAESLATFEALAKQAVGFSEPRGDQITVTSAPFQLPEVAPEDGALLGPEWVLLLAAVARGAAVLLALVLFARLVVRPALQAVAPPEGQSLPARVSELEGDAADAAGGALAAGGAAGALPAGGLPAMAAEAGGAASFRTEEGARTLRNWLNQG